jgi:hypothetical protein
VKRMRPLVTVDAGAGKAGVVPFACPGFVARPRMKSGESHHQDRLMA